MAATALIRRLDCQDQGQRLCDRVLSPRAGCLVLGGSRYVVHLRRPGAEAALGQSLCAFHQQAEAFPEAPADLPPGFTGHFSVTGHLPSCKEGWEGGDRTGSTGSGH